DQYGDQAEAALATRPLLQRALGLDDEPAGAEQRIAEDQRQPGDQGEGREAVEGAAAELSPLDLEALDEGAEDDALREGGEARAIGEAVIPEGCVFGVPVAELEGDAAEDEREQHDQDREIDRRYDDRESEREGSQQAKAAQHQPGLVAVPDRRD